MTASENGHPGGQQLLDQVLDLIFYAPVGLLVSSLGELTADDLPELAEKGRGRVGRLLSNARVVGGLTVSMGRRSIESQLSHWRTPGSAPAGGSDPPEELHPPAPLERHRAADSEIPRRGGTGNDLAIPGYEALSASQVVRRLDGLGPSELEAIYEHEAATRSRRTILHRTQQLLGREDVPGTAGRPA